MIKKIAIASEWVSNKREKSLFSGAQKLVKLWAHAREIHPAVVAVSNTKSCRFGRDKHSRQKNKNLYLQNRKLSRNHDNVSAEVKSEKKMGLAQNCWHYSYLKTFIVWSLLLTLVQANSDHVSLLLFLLFSNCSPDPTTNSEITNSNVHNILDR